MLAWIALVLPLQTGAVRAVLPTCGETAYIADSVVVDPRDANRATTTTTAGPYPITVYRATDRGDCLVPSDAGLHPVPPFF